MREPRAPSHSPGSFPTPVRDAREADGEFLARPLVRQAITRRLSDQYEVAAQDVERILEATYLVIEREGAVDPPIRQILTEAGLSTQAFYRHFRSKDELLLMVLDDGRRRLATYLARQIDKALPGIEKIRAWIEGILAQASHPAASARTRPFMVGLHRLTEQFPKEQATSITVLVDLLESAIRSAFHDTPQDSSKIRRDAKAIYHLTLAVMTEHILARSAPSAEEREHLMNFVLTALGLPTLNATDR